MIVPDLCFALRRLTGRRKHGSLRRTKMPLARARRGEPATGPEPFADGGTAQTPQRRGAGAAGGIPTRTMRPHMRMNAQGYAGRKGDGGVAARRDTPTRFMPTVAENAPASRAAFALRSGPRCDRARTQSHDCGAARAGSGTPSAQGEARLGRSPPQIRGRQQDARPGTPCGASNKLGSDSSGINYTDRRRQIGRFWYNSSP